MSGGTDSSVAAMLLQDAGYEVTGITFRFYEKRFPDRISGRCPPLMRTTGYPSSTYDARKVFERTNHSLFYSGIHERTDSRSLYLMQQPAEMAITQRNCRPGRYLSSGYRPLCPETNSKRPLVHPFRSRPG